MERSAARAIHEHPPQASTFITEETSKALLRSVLLDSAEVTSRTSARSSLPPQSPTSTLDPRVMPTVYWKRVNALCFASAAFTQHSEFTDPRELDARCCEHRAWVP